MITTIITNYKRLENVKIIIENIKKQTIPSEIIIWDNSENDNDLRNYCDVYYKPHKNVSCSVRWKIAQKVNTEYVMVIDDDITPINPLTHKYLIDKIGDNDLIGTHGVVMTNKEYVRCGHYSFPKQDKMVDILKGRMIFFRSDSLKNLNLQLENFCEDDIIISSKFKKKMVIGEGDKYFQNLPEIGNALSERPDHYIRRTNTMLNNFKSESR